MKKIKNILIIIVCSIFSLSLFQITMNAAIAPDGKITITKDTFLDYFEVHNDATYDENTGLLTLTPDDYHKRGYAALKAKVAFTKPFSLKARVYLGDKSQADGGADGMGFMFHTEQTWKQGQDGNGFGVSRLEDVIGFKLDTYNNDNDDIWVDAIKDPQRFGGYNTSFGAFVYQDSNNWLESYDTNGSDSLGDAKQINNPSLTSDYEDLVMSYDGIGTLKVEYDGKVWELNVVDTFDMDVLMRTFVFTASTGNNKNNHSLYFESLDFYTNTGMVVVNHEDASGNKLAKEEILFYNFSYFDFLPTPETEWYTTYEKTFPDLAFNHMKAGSAPTSAPFEENVIKYVTYVYDIPKGTLIVRHEDEKGNLLTKEVVTTKKAGTSYTTSKLSFKDYSYVGVKNGSASVNGKYEKDVTKTVTYVYKKKSIIKKPEKKKKKQKPPITGNDSFGYITIMFIAGVISTIGYLKLRKE